MIYRRSKTIILGFLLILIGQFFLADLFPQYMLEHFLHYLRLAPVLPLRDVRHMDPGQAGIPQYGQRYLLGTLHHEKRLVDSS